MTKNATPGDPAKDPEACLDNVVPLNCNTDRTVRAMSDPATQQENAYARYGDGDLHVQASARMIPQWNWRWPSLAFPFALPRCVSGPDFKTEDAQTAATASSGRTVSVADPVASFNGTPCGSIVEYGVDFSTSDEE